MLNVNLLEWYLMSLILFLFLYGYRPVTTNIKASNPKDSVLLLLIYSLYTTNVPFQVHFQMKYYFSPLAASIILSLYARANYPIPTVDSTLEIMC